MKPAVLTPGARADQRSEVKYYRQHAGVAVTAKLTKAMAGALKALEMNPAIGSLVMGQTLGFTGMRTWRLDGFPLSYWYFEEDDRLRIARLVGQRQDASAVAVSD